MDLVICRWRSRRMVVVAILLRVKVSEKAVELGTVGSMGVLEAEMSSEEGRPQE